MRYPNGKTYQKKESDNKTEKTHRTLLSAANRGMSLEEDINLSNDYYRDMGIALINKRPTPINIVKVDYSKGARITDAYFEKQSTTDYNGVYKGRYIDFEAKNTKSNTAFPLSNISEKGEIYLLDASFVIDFYEHGSRKSIPYEVFKKDAVLIKQDYAPRLHYLDAVDQLYFK